MRFAALVRGFKEIHKLSLAKMARRWRMSRPAVCQFMSGARIPSLNPQNVHKWAKRLKIDSGNVYDALHTDMLKKRGFE